MRGLLFQGAKWEKVPKGNLEWHEQQRRARLFGTSETGSCSRWEYEGEVEQWAEEEAERQLAEMNVSHEQLAGLEEKEEESGSSVRGSETCLREY